MSAPKSKLNQMVNEIEKVKLEFEFHYSLSLDRFAGLLRLTIINCTPADVGKYLCRIFNPHGEDSCVAELLYDSERTQICRSRW